MLVIMLRLRGPGIASGGKSMRDALEAAMLGRIRGGVVGVSRIDP